MVLAIFAKKRTCEDGKTFYSYLTQLTNKRTGEVTTASVMFREECGKPKTDKCPINIEVMPTDANLSYQKFLDDTGEERMSATLWIKEWKEAGAYVDHSLDDFI